VAQEALCFFALQMVNSCCFYAVLRDFGLGELSQWHICLHCSLPDYKRLENRMRHRRQHYAGQSLEKDPRPAAENCQAPIVKAIIMCKPNPSPLLLHGLSAFGPEQFSPSPHCTVELVRCMYHLKFRLGASQTLNGNYVLPITSLDQTPGFPWPGSPADLESRMLPVASLPWRCRRQRIHCLGKITRFRPAHCMIDYSQPIVIVKVC
jgi:hypothetical protein